MSAESPAWANLNSTYGAEQTRRAVFFGINSVGGVKGATDLLISTGGGMSVNIATGEIIVPGSSTNEGSYYGLISTTTNLFISTSDPTNPRIDTVCATVDDKQYGASVDDFKLAVVTGTPTAGATLSNKNGAGTIPNSGGASSILVAYVLVPASASSIVSGDLLDARSFAYLANPGPFNARPSTGSLSVNSGDHIIVSSGSGTYTLPAPFKNARVKVTNYGSGVATVSQHVSEVIYGLGLGASGASSFVVAGDGGTATLESDGTSWYLTAGNSGANYVESYIGSNYASLTSTPYNITSVSLTAGTWFVTGRAIIASGNAAILPYDVWLRACADRC